MNEESIVKCIRFWMEKRGEEEAWLEFEIDELGNCFLHFAEPKRSYRVPVSLGDMKSLSSGKGIRTDGPNASCLISRVGPAFVIDILADDGFRRQVEVGLGLMFIALRNVIRKGADSPEEGENGGKVAC